MLEAEAEIPAVLSQTNAEHLLLHGLAVQVKKDGGIGIQDFGVGALVASGQGNVQRVTPPAADPNSAMLWCLTVTVKKGIQNG